jgi:Cof subfamily protein (haloacid dehalogenase superfamily)
VDRNSTPIRLVAFDLDGTLMDAGENIVHTPVRYAIQRALRQGVIITLATGRPFLFTRPVAVELGLDAPLICYQGGVIHQMDGRVLRNISFSASALESPVALARRRGWQCYVEADGFLFLDGSLDYDQTLFDIHSGPVRPVPDLVAVEPPPNQLSVYLPTGVTPEHVTALQAAFGSAATVMRTHANFINAIPAGVSKGGAVAWLAERLGVPQSAVMAVGDSDNDATMVGWAGIGVAMGDARPSVVDQADWVAPSLEEHGAAAALERFVLSRNS